MAAVIAPLAIGLLAGWLLAKAFHHREIAILERQQTADKNLIDEYREKLKGASPLEAASKLTALETTLAETRKELDRLKAREWQPPTDKQMAELKIALRTLGVPRKIGIASGVNTDCAELAEYFGRAFGAAGWAVDMHYGVTYHSAFNRGVYISGRPSDGTIHDINKIFFDVLGCSAVSLEDLKTSERNDIEIVIGPKFPTVDK